MGCCRGQGQGQGQGRAHPPRSGVAAAAVQREPHAVRSSSSRRAPLLCCGGMAVL
jgi:hypothetical protein